MSNRITCSGALFYTLKTNRFLFLHRANGKRGNMWGLVGGTNEGAETPFEGLKREIEEEIGLCEDKDYTSKDLKFLGKTYFDDPMARNWSYDYHLKINMNGKYIDICGNKNYVLYNDDVKIGLELNVFDSTAKLTDVYLEPTLLLRHH